MNGFVQFLLLLLALAVGNVLYKIYRVPTPQVPDETWWGPGDKSNQDTKIHPFKIEVPVEVLDDLKLRLSNSRELTPPLVGIQQQYGFNTKLLKEISNFWINNYNWNERQQFLNQYPQFKTNIQGLNIHFIHVKPKVQPGIKVVPLLLLHGWPGSVREFYEIIPYLTKIQPNKNFVFEVIIPSLPGYGFSDAATIPGLGAAQAAVIFKNLMIRLGFDQYYVQGGDWGSTIANNMAIFYPERVKGLHSNLCVSVGPIANLKTWIGGVWPSLVVEEKYAKKMYPLSELISRYLLEFGYLHLQATKPDTIGVALNDSPIGLAAYILEKFVTWTNGVYKNRLDGGLLIKYDYNKLLDNVMIYWVTNSITTSMRFYAETLNKDQNALIDHTVVTVPSACAVFDNEIFTQPPSMFKERYVNLIQANEYDGGHFAAFEVPKVLAEDIWEAVNKFEYITYPKKQK